jgi:hypothetical protein
MNRRLKAEATRVVPSRRPLGGAISGVHIISRTDVLSEYPVVPYPATYWMLRRNQGPMAQKLTAAGTLSSDGGGICPRLRKKPPSKIPGTSWLPSSLSRPPLLNAPPETVDSALYSSVFS